MPLAPLYAVVARGAEVDGRRDLSSGFSAPPAATLATGIVLRRAQLVRGCIHRITVARAHTQTDTSSLSPRCHRASIRSPVHATRGQCCQAVTSGVPHIFFRCTRWADTSDKQLSTRPGPSNALRRKSFGREADCFCAIWSGRYSFLFALRLSYMSSSNRVFRIISVTEFAVVLRHSVSRSVSRP